jgi:hypothetical protein
MAANDSGDMAALYRAGIGLMAWYRQVERGRDRPKCLNALDTLISDTLHKMPHVGPKKLWDDFARIAEHKDHDVLLDFDDGILTYAVTGRDIDINFKAFRKRVQRIKKTMLNL